MMYAKLALRNVKRSAKDYLIYVITLILSVGLFYGFMSIASPYYNESLPVKINLEILNKAMRIAVPIVALLVVFLISYVNTYMLRRKQKEFAVQTIIGMEQRTVAFIFFVETMIMGAISIIFGILLGIGLSQIVGYIVVQSFGVEWQPYLSLFPDTILFTLLFFGAIFIVMGIRNIRTVRQLKIIDMLHNSQRGNEKFTLYHQLSRWIVIAVIASIAVLGMMFALIMKVSIQPHILWQFIALVIVATLSIVAAIWFFIECRHGKSGSIPLVDSFRVDDYTLNVNFRDSNNLYLYSTEFVGNLPDKENEVAVSEAYLKHIGRPVELNQEIELPLQNGKNANFTVCGLLHDDGANRRYQV